MYSVVYDHQIFCLQQYGGISRYFCELASRIHRAPGFKARIVAPLHFNGYLPHCEAPQSAVYLPRLPRTNRLRRVANTVLVPLLTRASAPSLIHQTYFTPPAKPVNVPFVVTVYDMIHELFAEDFAPTDPTSRNKRLCVDRADHVVCISESTANDLVRLFGTPREKISVTHLGYSTVFEESPAQPNAPPRSRPYLLYVGERDRYKNFDMALKAYASSPRLCREFDLLAFGGPPFNATELALIASLKLRPDSVVQSAGSDSDLARAYRHARALVYPSRYEGFGMPPLEAMSCGCAVACSNTSSLPEVVGDAAAAFDPDDLDSIRLALEDLCLSDQVRARLINAGNERVRQFSWDRCAANTLEAYRRALSA